MKSKNSVGQTLAMYSGFSGVNTSVPDVAMESPQAQAFVFTDNLWCSPDGYLSNERPLARVGTDTDPISHLRFYAGRPTAVAYAVRLAGATELRILDRAGARHDLWPRDATPTSCIFNKKVVFVGGGSLAPAVFDGSAWGLLNSADSKGASYCCTVNNRLVFSGYDRNKTEVIVSRVNREDVMASDEVPGEASVTKAFRMNVANLLGTADYVRGVSPFGDGYLAIFTNDRVLVYSAPADYTQWALDTSVNIQVGTISHNTISAVGDEVFFCSRSGVHSLRRSALNGTTVFTRPLSRQVGSIYRKLLASVRRQGDISALYDPDNGRYTIFFPVGSSLTYRLALDVVPRADEQSESIGTWSLSSFGGLTCAAALAGNTVAGSIGGFYSVGAEYDDGLRGEGTADTPFLWHGDILSVKQSQSLVLHASGDGRVIVSATSESGRDLGQVEFDISTGDGPGRTDVLGVPIQSQFERPFRHSYVGVRLRIRVESGEKQVRISAIGIRLMEI